MSNEIAKPVYRFRLSVDRYGKIWTYRVYRGEAAMGGGWNKSKSGARIDARTLIEALKAHFKEE